MGGGDLNMKKSWHPLLMKNQERVWKEEQKALSERKQLRQLQKERDEERQIQELQRMGGKRDERVDWLYNAPAEGSGPAPEELEQYLLGKKSVEQVFKKKDEEQLAAIKAGSGPDAAKNAAVGAPSNPAAAARDMSSKVREDPMLSIKKQEMQLYEALLKNPAKMKKLRAELGLEDQDAEGQSRSHSKEHKGHHSKRGEGSRRERSRSPDFHRARRSEREPRSPRNDDPYRSRRDARGSSPSRDFYKGKSSDRFSSSRPSLPKDHRSGHEYAAPSGGIRPERGQISNDGSRGDTREEMVTKFGKPTQSDGGKFNEKPPRDHDRSFEKSTWQSDGAKESVRSRPKNSSNGSRNDPPSSQWGNGNTSRNDNGSSENSSVANQDRLNWDRVRPRSDRTTWEIRKFDGGDWDSNGDGASNSSTIVTTSGWGTHNASREMKESDVSPKRKHNNFGVDDYHSSRSAQPSKRPAKSPDMADEFLSTALKTDDSAESFLKDTVGGLEKSKKPYKQNGPMEPQKDSYKRDHPGDLQRESSGSEDDTAEAFLSKAIGGGNDRRSDGSQKTNGRETVQAFGDAADDFLASFDSSSRNYPRSSNGQRSTPMDYDSPPRRPVEAPKNDAAAKLADMQSAAQRLESSREARLKAIEEQERREQEIDSRKRKARGGDVRPSFVRDHERQMGNRGVGERLANRRR